MLHTGRGPSYEITDHMKADEEKEKYATWFGGLRFWEE
jgi:hypothetical protein